jgi:hypothetical protein
MLFFEFLILIVLLFLFCVCVGVCPNHKGGFTYFVLALASHLDYGVLVGCLPFVAYHNFNNGCLIDFLILI